MRLTEREAMEAARREYWQVVMSHVGNKPAQAAKIAGVSRTQVYKIIKRLDLPFTPLRGNWKEHGL